MDALNKKPAFIHKDPSDSLKEYIECYWQRTNNSDKPETFTIVPDSFFKIIFEWQHGKLITYYITGFWTKEMTISISAQTVLVGIKFKILAPEYLLKKEIASILNSYINLDSSFLNMDKFQFSSFNNLVNYLESIFITTISTNKPLKAEKLQLSQLLYATKGNIMVDEVSNQINWSNSQINRYLNKYLGIPLKTYLNIQKCYDSYFQIRDGEFYPTNQYFDQAHFIKEIKKHTGQTPTQLFKKQSARFIQLKHIKKK